MNRSKQNIFKMVEHLEIQQVKVHAAHTASKLLHEVYSYTVIVAVSSSMGYGNACTSTQLMLDIRHCKTTIETKKKWNSSR